MAEEEKVVNIFDREYTEMQFLENPKMKVIFEKKPKKGQDKGDMRTMLCTSNMDLIPKEFHPKPLAEGAEPKVPSEVIHNVFDLEAGGWRSFAYERVKSMESIED